MTTTDKTGGPAFPGESHNGQVVPGNTGMTLRDWFAGQALAGIYANSSEDSPAGSPGLCARDAYDAADAMIAARKIGGVT